MASASADDLDGYFAYRYCLRSTVSGKENQIVSASTAGSTTRRGEYLLGRIRRRHCRVNGFQIQSVDGVGQPVVSEDRVKLGKRLGTVARAWFDIVGQNALCP